MRNALWLSLALALGPFSSPPEERPKMVRVVQISWIRTQTEVEKRWSKAPLDSLQKECDRLLDAPPKAKGVCYLKLRRLCKEDPDPTGMDWCQRAKFFPLMDQCYYNSDLWACHQAMLIDCKICQDFKPSIAEAIEIIGQDILESALEIMSQTAPSKSWTLTTTSRP